MATTQNKIIRVIDGWVEIGEYPQIQLLNNSTLLINNNAPIATTEDGIRLEKSGDSEIITSAGATFVRAINLDCQIAIELNAGSPAGGSGGATDVSTLATEATAQAEKLLLEQLLASQKMYSNSFLYDASGNLTVKKYFDGTAFKFEKRYTYNPVGDVSAITISTTETV